MRKAKILVITLFAASLLNSAPSLADEPPGNATWWEMIVSSREAMAKKDRGNFLLHVSPTVRAGEPAQR